jgi:type II secretory pathway pseudopilin PulG
MNERTAPLVRNRNRQAGFSLVETLVAAALLLFIIIGILPLFERSRLNLVQGNDASNVANATIDVTERLLSLPFSSQDTNIAPGSTQSVVTDFWLSGRRQGNLEYGGRWVTDMTPYPNDKALYTRSVTIEQFQLTDLTDNGVLDTPLDGGAPEGTVQLKRITTDVVNTRTALAGPATTYHVVTIQTF